MIEILHCTYPQNNPVLKDISLTINTGEIAGIIGKPGAGKSMLLKTLSGMNQRSGPGSGSVAIHNKKINAFGRKELARTISYYNGRKPDNMDESLFDFLMLSRISHKNFFRAFSEYDLQVVEQNIGYFDLTDLQKKRLGELSDIQMKKAMLAVSFIRTPKILLMDNPTAGLDIGTIHTLSREITRSVAEGDTTAVIVTHDLNFIAQIADRIIIIEGGEIAEDGTVDLLNAETIRKYYSVEVFVSRNVYNGRPNIHLFPNN